MVAKKISAQKEVMKGVIDLIRHKVFYGHILQQLTKVYTGHGIPTMGVGKRVDDMLIKLYINQDFVQKIWDEADSEDVAWQQLLGVLEHEVLHIILDHLTLRFSDKTRGAVAVDLSVNSYINRNNLPPSGQFAEDYSMETKKSAMWYYQNLQDNEEFKKRCAQGQFGAEGMMSDAVNSHEMWEDAAKDPLMKEFVKDIIKKSHDLCNNEYGSIPGEIIGQVDILLQKKKAIIPWNKVLRNFAASACESNLDYTMKKISRRFGTRPGTRKEDVLNLAVAVDTSGSICDDQLKLFFNEIKWIWKNGANITVYEADMAICHTYKFKGKFNGNVHGRGGTDLEPVLIETEGKYDGLIYFTDFYAPHIEKKYRIPTLWVLTTEMEREQFPYPWGKHIKIEDNRARPV